jgi:hypothetical protein
MPIKVHYVDEVKTGRNGPCTIRPTPFIQISENVLKNKEGNFGVTYSITLTGTLLADHGTPYALNPASNAPFGFLDSSIPDLGPNDGIGPYGLFDAVAASSRPRPPRQQCQNKNASAILSKQRALRGLFARDGQKVTLTDIDDDGGTTIICYPRVTSVDFTEGPYVTKCEYTIVLETDLLLRDNAGDPQSALVDLEGTYANTGALRSENTELEQLLTSLETFFIEDYSEDWSLEADDAVGESIENPRSYRISHSLSATGKTVYNHNGVIGKPAWQQAKDFVHSRLSGNPSGHYPNVAGQIGSGTVNLVDSYGGYNHVRTEQINQTNGTYSVSENWLLSSGMSTENFSMSTSTSTSDPFVTVSIDGTIKGLSNIPPDKLGDPALTAISGAYANALNKYNGISNSGQFGLTSDIYKRANNLVAVQLNSQPTSLSIGTNQYTGDVTYNLSFNNRPTNIISGVVSEVIQINDTYPGDVFAIIPVLGRKTGPILQYIGGRTEYKRDVSINLVMDYTKIPYSGVRQSLILKKPSLVEPTASQLAQLLKELSPQGEPGVRKYFISPPSESWSPKEGTYSFNISFTYELDK